MKQVLLITELFPFVGGEEFLESEVEYWSNSNSSLTIAPFSGFDKKIRSIPDRILLTELFNNNKITFYIRSLFFLFFRRYLYKELYCCFKCKKLSYINIKLIINDVLGMYVSYNKLKYYIVRNKIDTIYTYWNHKHTYASCLLKEDGLIKSVVSRCHRFDIYEEERKGGYIPLKRIFKDHVDLILPISKSQMNYYSTTYGFEISNIKLARLGVDIPNTLCEPEAGKKINVLSVSYFRPIKRVDLIMKSLYDFAESNKDWDVTWTHIGGSEHEISNFTSKYHELLQGSLKVVFKGSLSNKEVRIFYQDNKVDVFVNSSGSEGVPVSIMEAMSYGVPVLASNVGSTHELLPPKACELVYDHNSPRSYTEKLVSMLAKVKTSNERTNCHKFISENYNREINYKSTIKDILNVN